MALNYTNFRNLAERLIEENGRTLTLVRLDQGNPADPAKPWRESTDVGEITFAVLGVFIEFEKEDFDGTLVRRGDKRILVADQSVVDASNASNLKIEDYDFVQDVSTRWKIMTAETIEPGPLRIFYDLHVRQ